MKVKFLRKTIKEELIPNDLVIIEKVILLKNDKFKSFVNNLLDDYDFIKENIDFMYIDEEGFWHAILITSLDSEFGILVQSEGYSYAKYAAYLPII